MRHYIEGTQNYIDAPDDATPEELSMMMNASFPAKGPSESIVGMTPDQLNALPPPFQGKITGMGGEGVVKAPPPRWKQNIAMAGQEFLPVAGTITGEVLAAPATLASGPFAPVTAAGAGGLGWLAGKTASRSLKESLGFRERGRPSTLLEAGKDVLSDIPESVFAGLTNQLLGRLPVGNALKRVATDEGRLTREALHRMKTAESVPGADLTAAEATQKPGLQKVEGMLSQSLFGSGQLRDFVVEKQLKPLTAMREKLIREGGSQQEIDLLNDQIKQQTDAVLSQLKTARTTELNQLRTGVQSKLGTELTQGQTGQVGKGAIEKRSQAAKAYISKLYGEVNGPQVPLNKTRDIADALIAEEKANPSGDMRLISDLLPYSSEGQFAQKTAVPEWLNKYFASNPAAKANFEMKQASLGQGNGLKWQDAHFAQSRLGEMVRLENAATATPGMKGYMTPAGRAYSMLQKGLREDMEIAAKGAGPEVYGKYRKAQEVTRKFKGIFDEETLKLAQTDPQQFVRSAIQPKSGELIAKAKAAMGERTFEGKIKPAFTNELLGVGKQDVFSPQQLKSQLERYGDETLLKVYTPAELSTIKGLATDGKLALESKPLGHSFLRSISATPYHGMIVDSIVGAEGSRLASKTLSRNLALMKSVVDKKTFDGLTNKLMERLWIIDPTTQFVNPNRFATNIERLGPALDVAFGKETANSLRNAAQFARSAQGAAKFNPSGTGQSVVSWSQYGLLFNGITQTARGDFGQGGVSIAAAISPAALARLYLSKAGQKLMIQGFRIPANTKAGAQLAAKIVNLVGQNNIVPIDSTQE
jgi:hypothetical protein